MIFSLVMAVLNGMIIKIILNTKYERTFMKKYLQLYKVMHEHIMKVY